MAADRSVMFQGLTNMAPAPRDCEAPVNSLSIRTPADSTTLLHAFLFLKGLIVYSVAG